MREMSVYGDAGHQRPAEAEFFRDLIAMDAVLAGFAEVACGDFILAHGWLFYPYAWAGSQVTSASQLKIISIPISCSAINGMTPR